MKRRILCLVLTLALAFTVAAVPAAAAAPYQIYIDAVKAAIAENGTGDSGYGMLYDLDGSGTDELLMLYRSRTPEQPDVPTVVLSVYTISDGACKALLDHIPLYTEAGGTTGAVSVVSKGNDTLLLAEHDIPEGDGVRQTHTGGAVLYAMLGGAIAELSRLEYHYAEIISEGGDWVIPEAEFTCTEHTAGGTTALTSAQYQAWMNALERRTLLVARDLNDLGDGLPLELLLGRLEGHIGAFVDVPDDQWYSDSVEWALLHQITKGTTDWTFSPDAKCTRAQMVTFLWRAHGSPKVNDEGGTPFGDVPADAYYYEAVRWAVTRGITAGTSDTTFSPDAILTRAQTVTFLWRDACHVSAEVPHFQDVKSDDYYAEAVGWAQETGVTAGTTPTTFDPAGICTRAQIVTFLSRAMCARGLHAADVTGLDHGMVPDYATDSYGKEILFKAVGDVDDFSIISLMLTAREGLRPDVTVKDVGKLHDGETFLLRTGIPDVAARYAVCYTIGSRTVTLAIMDSGRDGSVYLTEL